MKTQICDAPGCGAPAMGDDVAFWSGNLCGECWTEKFKPSHLRDPVAAYPVERRETIRWLRGVVASMVVAVMMAFGMPNKAHADGGIFLAALALFIVLEIDYGDDFDGWTKRKWSWNGKADPRPAVEVQSGMSCEKARRIVKSARDAYAKAPDNNYARAELNAAVERRGWYCD